MGWTMTPKKKKSVECGFDVRLLWKFWRKKLNERELEQVEAHLDKCVQCKKRVGFIACFGDRIKATVNSIIDDHRQS